MVKNMSSDKLLLKDWFISQYDNIHQSSENSNVDKIDYFKTIGLSLTIFTIFEFSMITSLQMEHTNHFCLWFF